MSPIDGGSAVSASSSSGMNSSGTSTWTRFPIHEPHATPLTNQAGIPQARPMMMSQPRLTCSRPAAATGPGCGGRKACVIDRPASIGIAYITSDLPPRLAATYTSGARMKMPMSKKIGMPSTTPVRPMASGAPLGPNRFSNRVVSASAPPDLSSIAPSTVPSPMITVM